MKPVLYLGRLKQVERVAHPPRCGGCMRWFLALFCTAFSLLAAQAETNVGIRFPAEVLRFQLGENSDLLTSTSELAGDNTLHIFVEPDWQLLMSARADHANVYARLEGQKAIRLSDYAQSLSEDSRGWQAVSLQYESVRAVPGEVLVTYSLVHP
jgi:hypothetical protein